MLCHDWCVVFSRMQNWLLTAAEADDSVVIDCKSTYQLTDPVTVATTEIEYGKIPCRRTGGCNPFVPAELRGNETPSSGAGIAWGRRFDDVGGHITENKRATIRSWAGLRGQLSDRGTWEASFGYGKYQTGRWRRKEIQGMNIQQATNEEKSPTRTQSEKRKT